MEQPALVAGFSCAECYDVVMTNTHHDQLVRFLARIEQQIEHARGLVTGPTNFDVTRLASKQLAELHELREYLKAQLAPPVN